MNPKSKAGLLLAMHKEGVKTFAAKVAWVKRHVPSVADAEAFVGELVKDIEKALQVPAVGGAYNAARELLGCLRAASSALQSLHWQVSGETSHQDHVLLGSAYETLYEQIDPYAESVVLQLGADAVDAEEISEIESRWHAVFAEIEGGPMQQAYSIVRAAKERLEETRDAYQVEGLLTLGGETRFGDMHSASEKLCYLLGQRVGPMQKALVAARQPGRLLKARGHKYIRREATGNPKSPWRYVYKDAEGREYTSSSPNETAARQTGLDFGAKGKPGAMTPQQATAAARETYTHPGKAVESVRAAGGLVNQIERLHQMLATASRPAGRFGLDAPQPETVAALRAYATTSLLPRAKARLAEIQQRKTPGVTHAEAGTTGRELEMLESIVPAEPKTKADWTSKDWHDLSRYQEGLADEGAEGAAKKMLGALSEQAGAGNLGWRADQHPAVTFAAVAAPLHDYLDKIADVDKAKAASREVVQVLDRVIRKISAESKKLDTPALARASDVANELHKQSVNTGDYFVKRSKRS